MKTRGPLLVLLVTAPIIAGCEDTAAKRRAEAQERIIAATYALRAATATAGDPTVAEETRNSLREVVREASGVRDVDPGQEAAAALLAAAAHRELAALDMAELEAAELAHRQVRSVIHSHIDSALRLDALADGAEAYDTNAVLSLLADERTTAEQQLHSYSEQLAELDGPIAERRTQNELESQEASRLETEASLLRREAAERGAAEGLAAFERAIRLERDADRFEYQIAQRENDLRYTYVPEHTLASAMATYLQTKISDIDDTEGLLQRQEELTGSEMVATRSLILDFQQRIDEALASLDEAEATTVAERYGSAADHLEQAVSQARRAAGGSGRDGRSASALAVARGWEMTGRLHWSRARSLADHLDVLGRMTEGDVFENVEQHRRRLGEVASAQAEAQRLAIEAFTQAQEQLGQVQGPAIAGVRDSIAVSLAGLTGGPELPETEPAEPAPGDPPPASTPTAQASPSGTEYRHDPQGAESPDAIVTLLREVDGIDDVVRIMDVTAPIDTIPGLSGGMRQATNRVMGMLAAMGDLDSALKTQFGEGIERLAEGGLPMQMFNVPAVADAQIETVAETTGSVLITLPDGTTQTRGIRKLGERWFIDPDDGMMGGMGGGMGAGGDDPEAQRMAEQMVTMLSEMFGMMSQTFGALAGSVRAGEFTSFEEFSATAQTQLEQLRQGFMGGMPGGGP